MNIDTLLEEIKHQRLDRTVDVVAPVMEAVQSLSGAQAFKHTSTQALKHSSTQAFSRWRIPVAAAAAAVLLIVAVVPFVRSQSYNEELIGTTIAQVNDYSSYPCYSTIEESAVAELSSLDYLYEEY